MKHLRVPHHLNIYCSCGHGGRPTFWSVQKGENVGHNVHLNIIRSLEAIRNGGIRYLSNARPKRSDPQKTGKTATTRTVKVVGSFSVQSNICSLQLAVESTVVENEAT